MKTKVIIVRHAEAMGNIKREYHGWTDEGITEKGHKQAALAAEKLTDETIDVLYASSMQRTLETAQYIAKKKHLNIIPIDALKELNGGEWEGKKWEDLPLLYPKDYVVWEDQPHLHVMPGGESMKEFHDRVLNAVMDIIRSHKGKNICIVTHGTAIKALMCTFRGLDLNRMVDIMWYDNTAVTVIEMDHDHDRYKIIIEGDNTHLGTEYSTLLSQEWYQEYLKRFE